MKGFAALLLGACTAASAADPAFYTRRATWQETMLASREALRAAEQTRLEKLAEPVAKNPPPAFQPLAIETDAGQKGPRHVKVRVSGLSVVWLSHAAAEAEAGEATSPSSAQQSSAPQAGESANAPFSAIWGEPTLTAKDGRRSSLLDLTPLVSRGSMELIGGTEPAAAKGRKRARTIRVGRREFTRGIAAQTSGELCYRLDGQFDWLEADVAVLGGGKTRAILFRASHLPLAESLTCERDRATLWRLIERDFTTPEAAREIAAERARAIWDADWPVGQLSKLAQRYAGALPPSHPLRATAATAKTPADVLALARAFHEEQQTAHDLAQASSVDLKALRLAIQDLAQTFGAKYPRGAEYLKRLEALEKADFASLAQADAAQARQLASQLVALQREALLDNPLLDFDKLLLVQRSAKSPKMGMPQNWQGNCSLPRSGFDDQIAVLSPVRPGGRLTTLYRPTPGAMIADVDLHFDADRLLFSSLNRKGLWQIFEVKADGSGLRQVTTGPIAEVDNYDPCYLPDGRIVFASAAVMHGVPCVGGKDHVANLYLMNPDGSAVRQLCFDQDHNWCPTVMNDGRVMFSRWEYGDTPHYFTRLLFRMNPDGTQQMELSGSNSYWPNSTFYARPIPGHPSKVVAVASGHHGVPRMGELILFDTAKGRREADGVVQRIPGRDQEVEPHIADGLVNGSWPKFAHPWPLSDKYFLVSSMPKNGALWGIYLVDVFDNRLLLCETAGHGLFEPVPLRKTPRPQAIPDKVNLARKDALIYLIDIYAGDGLRGVPRGAVKALRVFEWHYAYQGIGGHQCVGVESGWEPKRILGTVPVEADGSALFRVPANTPLAVQPLDSEGRALQLMRSWFVGMPGETLSCVGCHESQGAATGNRHTAASQRPPRNLTPWHGPARGLSFARDVQPVLDAHCTRCHNGQPRPDGARLPDFADTAKGQGGFTKSYLALHPYVRRPGPESDYHMLHPADYLANTSELIQMLTKGHHGVELDPEAWDRLYTWIDLNAPDHGTWTEQAGEARVKAQHDLRAKYRKLFANVDEDPEAIFPSTYKPPAARTAATPDDRKPTTDRPMVPGWPFDAAEARKRQAAAGPQTTRTVDLGGGAKLDLVLIPAGEFLMGEADGDADERPATRVRIERPFWLARTETTNAQFRYFDPTHDSRFIDQHWKDHTTPGYPANNPDQPAVRVSWQQAMAFCDWLSRKTGERFALPTEAQWEWACRAGSATPLAYGGLDDDFSKHANLADASLRKMAVSGVNPKPIANPSPFQDFLPKDSRFNDGEMISCAVGKYQPNAWGLLDMHGNVAEWTLSAYRPYPYVEGDGRNQPTADGLKVARGGSWFDRPRRCRSAFRLAYYGWQGVYNVGFRVACPAALPVAAAP